MSWYLERGIHDKMYLSIDQQTHFVWIYFWVAWSTCNVHMKHSNIQVFFDKFHGVVINDHGLVNSIKLLLVTVLLFWIWLIVLRFSNTFRKMDLFLSHRFNYCYLRHLAEVHFNNCTPTCAVCRLYTSDIFYGTEQINFQPCFSRNHKEELVYPCRYGWNP